MTHRLRTLSRFLAVALALTGLSTAAGADSLWTDYLRVYAGSACKPKNPNVPHEIGWTSVKNTGTTNQYFVCPVTTEVTTDLGMCRDLPSGSFQCSDGTGIDQRAVEWASVTVKDPSRRYTTCYIGFTNHLGTSIEWFSDQVFWSSSGSIVGTAPIHVAGAHNPENRNLVVTCALKPGQELTGYTVTWRGKD